MHFSTSAFALSGAALLAMLAAAPKGAQAVDNRQLIKHPSQNGKDFCNNWRCACVNYVPQDPSLYFQYTFCQPGDYQGKNTDTEALAYCAFTDGSKTQLVDKHVAASVGGTVSS